MSRKPNAPVVAEIAAALNGRGRRGHTPLWWFMWDNFGALRQTPRGRADWITATEGFNKLHLGGPDAAPLKPENVRKTWERVVKERERSLPPPLVPPRPPLATKASAPIRKPVPEPAAKPAPVEVAAGPAKTHPLDAIRREMNQRSGRTEE